MKPRKWSLTSRMVFLLILILVAVVPTMGHAATFTVNSTLDTPPVPANCASGTGTCTLRAAIQAANASVGVPDLIILPANAVPYTLSIAGQNENNAATGDLDITGLGGSLEIRGDGAATTIIDGGALDTVLDLIFAGGQGANATILGVTIRNGRNDAGLGGGININTGATLTLKNSVVTGCKAFGAAAGASGVDNSGTLTMDTVAVTNNDGPGGGVNNGAAGVLTWLNGEVSGNKNTDVNAGGGGIQNNGSISLTNITISSNTSSGQGAAIDNDNAAAAIATLLNVTISENTSTAAVNAIGGIRSGGGGTVNVRNTIISGNSPANCGGVITSQGNNIDNGTTCGFVAGASGDKPATDPLLGALDLYGTLLLPALKTRALSPTSPAIDAGSAIACATIASAKDARGIPRSVAGFPPAAAVCDIGAYEFRPPRLTMTLPPPFDFGTVTSATTSDHTITLTNVGDGTLVIGTIAAAAADPLAAPFSLPVDNCSAQTLALNANCTITTRFSPTTAVLSNDTFSIPSNDPITAVFSFALSGTGTLQLVPNITVTDSIAPANDQQVPFGNVLAGASADATITVTNTGTANLVIGTIASANPLSAPFSILSDACSGQTVAPAATCTLTVRFAPTSGGQAIDAFDIPSTGLPAVTVALNGTGTTTITTPGSGNNPPSNPVLVSPTNGQTGVPTTMTFTWRKSADPDTDAVTYHVIYSTDPNLANPQTVDVAAAKTAGLLFAGLGSMGGGIILFGFVSGSGMKRSRKLLAVIPILLLMGTLFTACGGGGSSSTPTTPVTPTDVASTTVTGLAANTTYFWKVVADDGKGGQSSSEIFSFKTQ